MVEVEVKNLFNLSVVTLMCSAFSTTLYADARDWAAYRSVERRQHQIPTQTYQYTDQNGLTQSKQIPIRPSQNYGQWGNSYPNYPHYPHQNYPSRPYPVYPQQNGVTIIYQQQFPTQTQSSGSSYGYVNGDGGRIESSQYMLISDWRRYGLPDPQVGMHWIYENGRYIQIPNDR